MSCPECEHCARLAEVERAQMAAAAAMPVNPPGPLPSRLSAAEAVRRFGTDAGLRLVQEEYLGRAGVAPYAGMPEREAANLAAEIAARRLPPEPERTFTVPRARCEVCRVPLADPMGIYCPDDLPADWARPG